VRCDDPRCSQASKRWWSRKHALIAGRRLVEVKAQGRAVVEATLPLGPDAGPDEASGIISTFRDDITRANRRGADLKFLAVFHPGGRDGGPPHWHALIHSSRTASEVKTTVRAAWQGATGENHRLHCERIKNPVGTARYCFQDTREHRRNPQVLKRGGPPAKTGNRFYSRGGERRAWKNCCAAWHKPPDPEALAERAAIQAVEREESAWIEVS
jgi:hypothetical protein